VLSAWRGKWSWSPEGSDFLPQLVAHSHSETSLVWMVLMGTYGTFLGLALFSRIYLENKDLPCLTMSNNTLNVFLDLELFNENKKISENDSTFSH
jgi:hypothetical protein